MNPVYVDIHTHRPTGRHIELRTAGIHPWDVGFSPPGRAAMEMEVAKLSATLDRGDAQAVGEIGLDFIWSPTQEMQEAQIDLFRAQLAVACDRDLPVVLHCVKAFEPTMRLLREQEPRAVIFHGFVGSPQQARQAVERGYYLSFGERSLASTRTVEALRSTPLRQLFLETDESPTPIETIYARAAALLGIPVGTLQRATTDNYECIFIFRSWKTGWNAPPCC